MPKVGCFEVELLDEALGRWQVFNTLTNIGHITYGDKSEVYAQLRRQSKIWEQQVSDSKLRIRGKKWRGRISAEIRQAAEAKTKKK